MPAGEGLHRNLVSQQIVKEKRSDDETEEHSALPHGRRANYSLRARLLLSYLKRTASALLYHCLVPVR